MKNLVAPAAFFAAALIPFAAISDDAKSNNSNSAEQFTLAVFGDWPYNQLLRELGAPVDRFSQLGYQGQAGVARW